MNQVKKTFFKHWDMLILVLLIVIYSITFSVLSILRHDAFASNYDLANMSQTVWNTLHSRPFALTGAFGTVSRFSIHADLILVFLTPLYLIWERAYMLLVAQSLALGLGAIPVYFLARKVLGAIAKGSLLKLVSLCMVLAYLLNPGMEWTNIYDFHGVALAIPLLLAVFYLAYIKSWPWYWVFTALALTTKEGISLLIALLGLFIFFKKNKLVGASTFLVGIAWFTTIVFFVIPLFSTTGAHWALNDLYSTARERIFESRSLPQMISLTRDYLLSSDATSYYLSLLKPFAFLPLLGFPWLLFSVPELAINLFSNNALMRTNTLHYDSGIIPFLVISSIFGIKYLINFLTRFKVLSKHQYPLIVLGCAILILVAVRVNYHYSPLPTTPSCWCISYKVTTQDREFAEVLKTIPISASVTSSGEIRPHIARRENSFTLPGATASADYVAIIDENRIVGNYSPKEFENALLKEPVFLRTYQLISHIGHFYLFKKKSV